ncbi:MAG TPA: choice-of-anchor Q domain-containing protein [Flavilitoribacter sp.]|nr:choice-of-anchor Q domain-containing protein [Flavilitoribacter sp.]HMQ90395.1 choice-of-anchor Q domain-containing protein [Flavilitoribacter sp.]
MATRSKPLLLFILQLILVGNATATTFYLGNTIKNCYDVDDNHDDGIQSFTTNGYVVDHNIVRGNTILNFEDPNQPLLGPLQGIGCFDGFFNDWTVENNLISVNHWHGITFLGANNCRIYNNTVLDPTPDITPGGSWIMIDDHKNGMPSSNCAVRNNVANQFVVDGATGNNLVLNSYTGYIVNFADYAHFDFHLLPTSALIDAGDDSVAPPIDFDGVARPQGAHADIGAFEFRDATAVRDQDSEAEVRIYPNPVKDKVTLTGDFTQGDITIIDMQGQVVARFQSVSSPFTVNLSRLLAGSYFIVLNNDTKKVGQVLKITKL